MKVNSDFSGDWMREFDGLVGPMLEDGISVLIYGKGTFPSSFLPLGFLLVQSFKEKIQRFRFFFGDLRCVSCLVIRLAGVFMLRFASLPASWKVPQAFDGGTCRFAGGVLHGVANWGRPHTRSCLRPTNRWRPCLHHEVG